MCTFARALPFKVAMHFIRKLRKVPLRSQGGPFFIQQIMAKSVKTADPVKPIVFILYEFLRLKCNLACAPNPLKTHKNTYKTCIRHLTNRLEL